MCAYVPLCMYVGLLTQSVYPPSRISSKSRFVKYVSALFGHQRPPSI